MCSLSVFPPPVPEGYVTICERNGILEDVVAKEALSTALSPQHYPVVHISSDLSSRPPTKESARSAFLEHEDTLRKKLYRAWYEHGIVGVIEELAQNDLHEKPEWLSQFACRVIGLVRWAVSLHGSLFPHLALSSTDLIAEFSSTGDWRDGPVRCFAWHPHTGKFAVAQTDDSVRVYTVTKMDHIVPLLKHKLQRGVADMAWKPESACILAVACQSCVLIWHVDPMSLAARPSTSCVQVLSQNSHMPVTSVAWSPRGGLLLSASPADTAIMVWDVSLERNVPLRRVGGGGVTMLRWSPDGSKVLAACPSKLFRIWETQEWSCEKWSHLLSRMKTACWCQSGDILLFATENEPIIYALSFSTPLNDQSSVIGGSAAVVCADVSVVEMETEHGLVRVGGQIQCMAWDPTCERLAVQFTGEDSSSELIALFQTRIHPVFEVIPSGFVRGHPGEKPQLMNFQPTFSEGALLTVVWNSGRVSFIPLYFLSREVVGIQNQFLGQQTMNGSMLQSPSLIQSPNLLQSPGIYSSP